MKPWFGLEYGRETFGDLVATYIFKANADGFPDGNPDPVSPLDWDGGTFRSPLPKSLVGQTGKPPLPVAGDLIELWVNEGSRDRALRGQGYVGRGTISRSSSVI